MTLSSPWTRAIPSPDVSTVPVSNATGLLSKFLICCLMIEAISSALSCMTVHLLSDAPRGEGARLLLMDGKIQDKLRRGVRAGNDDRQKLASGTLETPADAPVDDLVADWRDSPPDKALVHSSTEDNLFSRALFQLGGQLLRISLTRRGGGSHLRAQGPAL